MKKFAFTIFWMVLCTFYATAECTFYGYYIDATGFLCGNSGRICFLTSVDWQCHDGEYEAQISFPTGTFTFPNSGDFTVTTSGGTTTLHAHLWNISEGTTSYCIEGTLVTANTIFSVRVASLDNPGTYLNPSNFAVDDGVTVGSGVGIPTLSGAIWLGLLLDATTAAGAGQRVIVDGTLQMDETSYLFGSSAGSIINEIVMLPGASMVVNPGSLLGTFRTNIHGCDDKWDRILVEGKGSYSSSSTNISDANTAIEIKDGGSLEMFNSHLSDNDIGIGSFGSSPKKIDLNIVPGSPFGYGNTIRNGIEGCHFENVNPLTIDAFLYIIGMTQNGIYLDKTDLTAAHLTIKGCDNYGIYVPTSNDLLSVSNCDFYSNYAGIISLGSASMTVSDNYFYKQETGIGRMSAIANENNLIEKNIFEECNYDILAFVSQSTADIHENEMQAEFTNVGVWGLGAGNHQWLVKENDVMLAGLNNTTGYNVTFVNVRGGHIFKNDMAYATKFNFHLFGGSNCTIDYNRETFSDGINIEADGSPTALIACNSGNATRHSISILNDCAGSTIKGNVMSSWAENLAYGSVGNTYANTGAQPNRGNIFDASSAGNPKAVNYSGLSTAQNNRYTVSSSAGSQGSIRFPYFTSADNQWFSKNHGTDYLCPEYEFDEPSHGKTLAAIDAGINVLNAGVGDVYGKAAEFDAQLNLYRSLTELKLVQPLDQAQQAVENQLAGSVAAQYVRYEQAYRQSIALTPAEQALIARLSAEIDQVNALILGLEIYRYDPHTELLSIDENQQTRLKAAVAQRDQKVKTLKNLLQQKQDIFLTALGGLKTRINNLPASNQVHIQNLKTANALLLQRLSTDFKGFTETQLQQLTAIATQCAGTGGEGVRIARTLLAESTLSVTEYNDECLTAFTHERAVPVEAAAASYFSVTPNPADDHTVVLLPRENNITWLSVMDIYGKEIMRKNVEKRQQVSFETASIPPGIYFIRASGLQQTIKLVIARQ